jgi:hypothetical protein
MDFTVYSQDGSRGGREDQYFGDDTFKVWDARVLEVATGGGDGHLWTDGLAPRRGRARSGRPAHLLRRRSAVNLPARQKGVPTRSRQVHPQGR